MESVFSKEIQAGLDAARLHHMRKSSRLRIDLDGKLYPVLRLRKTGFTVAADDAPNLRGLVDVFDGANHLFQCLIVASEQEGDQMHYEFKRATAVAAGAALDFAKASDAPVGLIAKG